MKFKKNNKIDVANSLPQDIIWLNQLLNAINRYMGPKREFSAVSNERTLILSLANAIYSYANEFEPMLKRLSTPGPFNDLAKLIYNTNANAKPDVKYFPLLETKKSNQLEQFKHLITELRNKIDMVMPSMSQEEKPAQAIEKHILKQVAKKTLKGCKRLIHIEDQESQAKHLAQFISNLNELLSDRIITPIEQYLIKQAVKQSNIQEIPSAKNDNTHVSSVFDQVPREIVCEILKHISAKDFNAMANSCRLFNKCFSEVTLWRDWLSRDYPDAKQNHAERYLNSPKTLYQYLYKKEVKSYWAVLMDPDTKIIVDNDLVRFINRTIRSSTVTMNENTLSLTRQMALANLRKYSHLPLNLKGDIVFFGFNITPNQINENFNANLEDILVEVSQGHVDFSVGAGFWISTRDLELSYEIKDLVVVPFRYDGKLFVKEDFNLQENEKQNTCKPV